MARNDIREVLMDDYQMVTCFNMEVLMEVLMVTSLNITYKWRFFPWPRLMEDLARLCGSNRS